jgi:glycosyltransferase involved in cell wall biosynthesis
MRVLLIDQFGELGGAQRGLIEAAEGFAERGWEAHAVVPEGPLVDLLRPLSASVTTIPCGPYQPVSKTFADGVRFARQFRRQTSVIASLIATRGADVLYVNGPRVLPSAAYARRGRPLVFHSHSVVMQPIAARVAGQSLRWADAHVLVSSNFVSGWLKPFVAPDRMQVIYNGIRSLGMTPRPRDRHTRIGMLGRIAPEKGQLTFVRAARIAAARDPGLTFVCTGAPVLGSAQYHEQVRAEAGAHVAFAEWTEDIGGFFAGIDVIVVPSEAVDANPRVIPEAYAAGVPVIAFDSGGIHELLEDQVTGILVREHSAEALAAAICDAVSRPQDLNQMAASGHRRWMERYTLPRFQSEVCDALERAARASASR